MSIRFPYEGFPPPTQNQMENHQTLGVGIESGSWWPGTNHRCQRSSAKGTGSHAHGLASRDWTALDCFCMDPTMQNHLPRQCVSRKAMTAAGRRQLIMRPIVRRKDSLPPESLFATAGRTRPPKTPWVPPTQAFRTAHQNPEIPKNSGTDFMAWCKTTRDLSGTESRKPRIARFQKARWPGIARRSTSRIRGALIQDSVIRIATYPLQVDATLGEHEIAPLCVMGARTVLIGQLCCLRGPYPRGS